MIVTRILVRNDDGLQKRKEDAEQKQAGVLSQSAVEQ